MADMADTHTPPKMEKLEMLTWDIPGHPTKRPTDIDPSEIDNVVNKMVSAPISNFEVRGPNYLSDKKKVPATEPIFQFVDLRSFSHGLPIKHVCKRIKPLNDLLAAHSDREFFIVNRMLPTVPPLTVVSVFVRQYARTDSPAFEASLQRYKDGTDRVKDLKLKYIVKIPNAPFMLRGAVSALGGFRPVIMGKGYLEQHHYSGANYTEVDIDVGSSRIARGIMGVVVPQMKKLNVDEAFLIEAQENDELPERLLGCQRGARYDFKGEGNEIVLTPDMLLDEGDNDGTHVTSPVEVAVVEASEVSTAAKVDVNLTAAPAPAPSDENSDSDDFADAES